MAKAAKNVKSDKGGTKESFICELRANASWGAAIADYHALRNAADEAAEKLKNTVETIKTRARALFIKRIREDKVFYSSLKIVNDDEVGIHYVTEAKDKPVSEAKLRTIFTENEIKEYFEDVTVVSIKKNVNVDDLAEKLKAALGEDVSKYFTIETLKSPTDHYQMDKYGVESLQAKDEAAAKAKILASAASLKAID